MFQPNTFYIPQLSNQVAFDSFILADGVLLIFQFTIALLHHIKEGIMPFFTQLMLNSMFQMTEPHFIFVIPHRVAIVCPESGGAKLKKFWKRVTLYLAEFDSREQTQPMSNCIVLYIQNRTSLYATVFQLLSVIGMFSPWRIVLVEILQR